MWIKWFFWFFLIFFFNRDFLKIALFKLPANITPVWIMRFTSNFQHKLVITYTVIWAKNIFKFAFHFWDFGTWIPQKTSFFLAVKDAPVTKILIKLSKMCSAHITDLHENFHPLENVFFHFFCSGVILAGAKQVFRTFSQFSHCYGYHFEFFFII